MILADTGPLVALVDADDQFHADCVRASRQIPGPLLSVWPVLTEAMYLLRRDAEAQHALWEMVQAGEVELLPLGVDDVPRIRELMAKYANRPMDLADAALVVVAEREGIRTIFTIDRKDFSLYRLHGRGRFTILP